MKNTVLSASMAFLIRLNYRGDAAVYGQNCGKGDLTLIVFGAALKVEQNPEKLKKCSTRLPSPKQCGLRLRANLRNQRFARNRGQVQRLSSCRAALHLSKSLPFTDTSMKMGMLSVNGLFQKWRLRTKWSKTTICP